jgi:hypothetical protein
MKQCIIDFEAVVLHGSYDMVVFIGHNGLMDFTLPSPTKSPNQPRRLDCVVLCCKSADYFQPRLTAAGGRPLLLTTQFMYPGSFILAAVAESWLDGAKRTQLRASAGAAYARNQKISRRAATGVFAALKD